MPIEVISLLIAFAGVCLAFVGSISNARKDSEQEAGRMAEIMAKLDFIGNDIKDIKADYRSVTSELQNVRDIAIQARASASSAHKRLDDAGIEQQHSH